MKKDIGWLEQARQRIIIQPADEQGLESRTINMIEQVRQDHNRAAKGYRLIEEKDFYSALDVDLIRPGLESKL